MRDGLWQRLDWATDLLVAGCILLGFLMAMLLVRLLWMRLLRPFVRRTETELDDAGLRPCEVGHHTAVRQPRGRHGRRLISACQNPRGSSRSSSRLMNWKSAPKSRRISWAVKKRR